MPELFHLPCGYLLLQILGGLLLGMLVNTVTFLFGCRSYPKTRFFLLPLFFAAAVPCLYLREVTLQLFPFADPLTRAVFLPRFGVHLFFLTVAVAVSLIDLEFYLIPDLIMIPATVIGVFLMTLFPNAALPNYDFHPIVQTPIIYPLTAFPGCSNLLRFGISSFCILFWVFALLDRRWYSRLGTKRAAILFLRRLFQSKLTIVLPLLGLCGIAAAGCLFRLPPTPEYESMQAALLSSLFGMSASMVLVWGVRIIGKSVLGQEAMGFGDVILMGFLGTIFGWQGGIILFFLAPAAGLLFGIARFCFNSKREIPYGPFLSLAALGMIFFWEPILRQVHDFLIGPLAAAILVLMGVLMALLLWVIQIIKRMFA